MSKEFNYIFGVLVMILCMGASCALARDITFRGKVIDADTKEPIEEAVVVVFWYEARETIAGESTRLKDVKETLTDKNGEWSITGPKGRDYMPVPYLSFLTGMYYTREPQLIIFKPGYCSWPKGFSIDSCKGKMKSIGEGEVMEGKAIELPEVSGKDRIMNLPHPLVGERVPFEKEKEFIRLINEERRKLGLGEYPYLNK